jgi:hypothetical protein
MIDNKENDKQCAIQDVMPRIIEFVCEYGYRYEPSDMEIMVEVVDGYTRYYLLDDHDYTRNYLKPMLYGA